MRLGRPRGVSSGSVKKDPTSVTSEIPQIDEKVTEPNSFFVAKKLGLYNVHE
jgi:hypothetical protein